MSEPIYLYDLSPLLSFDLKDPVAVRRLWDEYHLVSSLQGLVNRESPQLYIRSTAKVDDFWLERLTEEGAWCAGRTIQKIATLEDLLRIFKDVYQGLVVYDERVPATSNLASTIAGVEDLLCLRYDDSADSLYSRLMDGGGLPVKQRLLADDDGPMFPGSGKIPGTDLPSTGSPKNDAYRWLIEHYVKTGKTNARSLGYYVDAFWLECAWVDWPQNHTLTNHDYVIANRGIFFDLNVWEDEAPVEEPNQKPGTDLETLKALLDAANKQLDFKQLIHVAGYVPWAYKYTNYENGDWSAGSKHGAVPAEWKCTEILTCYNAYLDADALGYCAMANASFFRHFPLPDHIPQNPSPTEESLKAKGFLDEQGNVVAHNYYAHYVGDYDAAAWVYWNLPGFWTDKTRGEVPLSWAFNPNLAERFGFGLKWARDHRTPNDHFVAGDSGAGYVNPRNLSEPREFSGYPSAMKMWEEHCEKFLSQWDLRIVGFVLDGNCPNMLEEGWDAYTRFAPDGLVFHRVEPRSGMHNGVPFMKIAGDLPREVPKEAPDILYKEFEPGALKFICFRSVLMPPSWYVDIEKGIDERGRGNAVAVNMAELLFLLKRHLESK